VATASGGDSRRRSLATLGAGTVADANAAEQPSGQQQPARVGAALRRRGRALQNLEKVMFDADAAGRAPGVLAVAARREGAHRDGPRGGATQLVFNIGAMYCWLCVLAAQQIACRDTFHFTRDRGMLRLGVEDKLDRCSWPAGRLPVRWNH
jgi:hypothetical protein